jgi:hypothetical protein
MEQIRSVIQMEHQFAMVRQILDNSGDTETNQEIEHLPSEDASHGQNLITLDGHSSIDEQIHKRVADAQNRHPHKQVRKASQSLNEVEHINHQLNQKLKPLNSCRNCNNQKEPPRPGLPISLLDGEQKHEGHNGPRNGQNSAEGQAEGACGPEGLFGEADEDWGCDRVDEVLVLVVERAVDRRDRDLAELESGLHQESEGSFDDVRELFEEVHFFPTIVEDLFGFVVDEAELSVGFALVEVVDLGLEGWVLGMG